VFAHFPTGAFRRHYGLHASSAILFNQSRPGGPSIPHPEGEPRCGGDQPRARVRDANLGRRCADQARPGERTAAPHLDGKRDWGYAGDYVRAMWLMLQQDQLADCVVATGETLSVGEFGDLAFSHLGLDRDDHVRTDERFLRQAEVDHLVGDASKARAELGWAPEVSFSELVEMMVDADLGPPSRNSVRAPSLPAVKPA
jgi:GDPmannose 4,6-dehydratase